MISDDLLIINEKDNVGVSLKKDSNIPIGHKIALKDINKNEEIIKYGEIIGRASKNIKKGEWVHTHNIKSHLDEKMSYKYEPIKIDIKKTNGTFFGYKRSNGKVGIRNDIYIIPTVGCVNGVCKKIESLSQKFIKGSIDSIFCLTHQFGCSQLGNDHENIKNLLCDIALNPNATYVLFVGLGCENNSLKAIKEKLDKLGADNINYFNCQEVENEVEYGTNIIKELAKKASKLKRETVDMSNLIIGLKCGGSDAFSGITANPTVGKISDRIISMGGSAILTEVPEMFGAEQILMNKCINKKVFDKYSRMIEDFKNYYIENKFPVYENPSPGNKEGGISTLEEKSCGCITKAGNSYIVDVLDYGDRLTNKGLNVLNGPGNDLIASTILAAAGAQVILFTTGRGTPFSTFVPTIKIGTNNHISTFKNNWIDFDASNSDDEGLYKYLIDVINGKKKTKSESNKEIAFYKKGVTL